MLRPCIIIFCSLLGMHAVADSAAEVEAGSAFFRTGIWMGEPVPALVGDNVELSSRQLPCVSCHGSLGEGRPEGGVVPTNLAWARLTKPYEEVRGSGRHVGAYNAESFANAVRHGVDASGNSLDGSMPRYVVPDELVQALIAYLKTLDDVQNQKGSSDMIAIGVSGNTADVHVVVLDKLIAQTNAQGGVHGRSLALKIIGDATWYAEREGLPFRFQRTYDKRVTATEHQAITLILRSPANPPPRHPNLFFALPGEPVLDAFCAELSRHPDARGVCFDAGSDRTRFLREQIPGTTALFSWLPGGDQVSLERFIQFVRDNKLPVADLDTVAAYVAFQTLLEGLKRAGRDLRLERVREGLESLNAFHVAGLPVSFGKGVRIGSRAVFALRWQGERWSNPRKLRLD